MQSENIKSNKNSPDSTANPAATKMKSIEIPQITLPKGGGAIKGIEEKFQVNAVTGTSSFEIPIPLSPSRHGFAPSIGLNYNSGSGNSPFGIGWNLSIPSITRKTERELPQYKDEDESDIFILSGAEDLVPLLEKQADNTWKKFEQSRTVNGISYTIKRYRPRIEGLFARIEKWKNNANGETHWKTITKDNVHSYYGLTDESRISNPTDDSCVFEWLLCRTHDDKGNILINYFKKEDFSGVERKSNEKNRIGNCTQTYLKKIVYGNKRPYYLGDPIPVENDFMFRVIFDYGEHDNSVNIPMDVDVEKNIWTCRKDPFSTYRSGFEIRTYRRCKRVLVFHCFDITELPHSPYLTKSLELFYDDDLDLIGNNKKVEGFSYLVQARHNGHLWDTVTNSYKTKFLPELDIKYQQHEWYTEVKSVTPENIVNAPVGIDDKSYIWIDLFSEGVSGILTEQGNGWYYKSNLGGGNFSKAFPVAPKPSLNGLSTGSLSIQELEGNGVKYLVQFENEPKGFFKLSQEDEWESMKNFESFPNINPVDPNMRPIDLNGDGRADLLITEDDLFRWYPGAGEKGFEVSQTVFKEIDEEKGPAIIFADREQCIFLADMSGDGLTDIVRIQNGEICYWPNLGYGKFGSKVNMDNAPFFDHPDAFNPSFLRLADIDGSGTTDVVYLGKNDFRVWMNLNGNEWKTEPQVINPFPQIDNLADVAVLDFLGSGTACIVYSSPLTNQPLQYIDLMGSKKPHLFIGYENNCGKEVTIEYKPSTYYYLKDKKEGNKWITKLPFPVHCISKVRSEDKIRQTVFTNSYSYRHGYFDYDEREFRGFARVEQFDTEDFEQFKINTARNVVEEDLHQPPVKTISWFHTGTYFGREKILHQCKSEYFQNTFFTEYDLPEPIIARDVHGNLLNLTGDDLREALRACKGLPLRGEVYSEDGSSKSALPYTATQSNFEIRVVQPRGENKYASFLVIPSESISYSYERNPVDPRISQSFVLETDELGNVTKSTSVVYPRVARPPAPNAIPDKVWEEQNKMYIVYGESLYTSNDILLNDIYRLRAGYESKSYEISGIARPVGFFFNKDDLKTSIAAIPAAGEILFEEDFTAGIQKRLSSHSRVYFLRDDFTGPLGLGLLSSLGIAHKSYNLAFTRNLVTKYYGSKVTDSMLSAAMYVHSERDVHWWTQSGTYIYLPNPGDNFFTPVGAKDVFGNDSLVEYDHYTLLVKSTTNAIGNIASAVNDYRTLSPVLLTDPNMNLAEVETDELGLVIKSAVMGKAGSTDGDTLSDPTARIEYDLFNWKNNGKPNYVHMYAREKHGASNPRWQESYVYSDGGGNIIMSKVQAEPGKAKLWNTVTKTVEEVDANPRWVGNGRTILNNKGNPVKQYEPYFSTTNQYESEEELVETGITPIVYYDPVGRNIRTEFPNGTFSKIEFDSWYFKSFDVNDTVKDSKWYSDRGSPDPLLIAEPTDPETRAAWLAAKHYNTPGTVFTDSLGRSVYAVSDFGSGKTTSVYSESDLAGRYSKVFDQFGRNVSEGYINMIGASIYGKSAEKGERWIFSDVMGRLVRVWDNSIREMYCTFDNLHRPISSFVKEGANEILFSHTVYGDLFPDAEAKTRNMKGRAYQMYDQSGVVTIKNMDFKGNATEVETRLAKEYKIAINWNALTGINNITAIQTAAAPLLEDEAFTFSAVLDALNRPITATLPDNSIIVPKYNEANFLDSLRVNIRGAGDFVTFLESQDYDAKGQRQFAKYGNGTITNYFYDPQTFRLINLVTKLDETDGDNQSIQNLKYTFDPVGNITQQRDDAQQTHFFRNSVVYPENKFEYDAIYQLKKATGREHAGLGGNVQRDYNDLPFINELPHINDTNAVRNYSEQYEYDDCGNISLLQHIANNANWIQRYRYEYEDDSANKTNRLKGTNAEGDLDGIFSNIYTHDLHGNMTSMPHLSSANSMIWNFMDQLKEVNLGGGGRAYYVYGIGGNRTRKVIERIGGKKLERIYLGAVEIYRESQNDDPIDLERYTLHVSDNTGRIAQVDTKTIDLNNSDPFNALDENNIRYQYNNHLGSAMLETNEAGDVISYEEYHPYGTSAYRVSKSDVDLSLKRYRFSGKERDDETGFYNFGSRYYAACLGRWTSSDPAGFVDGLNLFKYCNNNPVMLLDPNGLQSEGDSYYSVPRLWRNEAEARQYWEGREIQQDGHTYRVHVESVNPIRNSEGRIVSWRIGSTFTLIEPPSNPEVPQTGGEGPTPETPPATPSEGSTPPPSGQAGNATVPGNEAAPSPGGTGGSSERTPGGSGDGTAEHERSFFTSSFFKGLAIGILTTVLVVAVVATAGAALAPMIAAAGVSASTVATVGTVAGAAGVAVTGTSIVQSVRQRDFWGNEISEEEANFNLGLGIGSLAGGAISRPLSGPTSQAGRRFGEEVVEGMENLSNGMLVPATVGGGSFGGSVSTSVSGVGVTSAVSDAAVGAGASVMMMANNGDGGGGGGSGTGGSGPLRGREATEAASRLGYDQRIPPNKAPFNSHGQPVFRGPKGRYITPDVDSHSGGVWKMFDRAGNRIGTYDANLNYIGK